MIKTLNSLQVEAGAPAIFQQSHVFFRKMMDRKDYWVQKEAEIGETVEAKFYCTYLGGDWPVKGPLTGILFFSKSTLYFQSFYSSKSLATLFQLRREEGIIESHAYKLPLKNLRCIFDDSPQTLLSRLFTVSEQPFVIHLTDGERETGSYRFSVDRKKLKTIASLINKVNRILGV